MILCPESELTEANIFVKKENITQKEGTTAYYYSSTSKHYDSSTSKHYDSSTSKHYGSSTSKHYDSSTSKHYDSSTSEHYGSSYCSVYEYGKAVSINNNTICRERSTGKIYLSNKDIQIVYV